MKPAAYSVGKITGFAALDLNTKTMTTFIDSTGAVDGLEGVGDSTYLISDWAGRSTFNSARSTEIVTS
jgi:hypothetical protein